MSGYVTHLREVDFDGRYPKYRQVIHAISRDIRRSILNPGDKIPSINEASSECYLSRDTVEKAYKELSRRGIIRSVPGKGFFVSESVHLNLLRILLIFDRLDSMRWNLFHSLNRHLPEALLTTLSYEHNYRMLNMSLAEHQDDFDFFIVIPHFFAYQDDLKKAFASVTPERLIVLTHEVAGLDEQTSQFTFDRMEAWKQALHAASQKFDSYNRVVLIFPEDFRYPQEIHHAVQAFCQDHAYPFKLLPEFDHRKIQEKDVVLCLDDDVLASVVTYCHDNEVTPGKDLAIVAFDDSPLKDMLAGGITCLTYNFEEIGRLTAERIATGNPLSHQFPLNWKYRSTF